MLRGGRDLSTLAMLGLALWLGLAAGLLEVGTRVLCRVVAPSGRLFEMSRHFVWITPLANVVVLLCVGLIFVLAGRILPRASSWICPRILLALAILPTLMVAVPGIFAEASLLLTMGIAVWIVPLLQKNPARLRAALLWTFPVLVSLVLILAGSIFLGDWLRQRREESRALPPSGTPNVLLIVLDTVRQDRLSLYGYRRSTTPTLERLAKRGIRFDDARSTAPWTLPSHASMMMGRWPHELGVEWLTPIRNEFPTVAEYLREQGYATAGFVANVQYCASDTGLSRGFTHYEDYVFQRLSPLTTSVMVEEFYRTILLTGGRNESGVLHALENVMSYWINAKIRKEAAVINRDFVRWLDQRRQIERPFFVFLNYLDAHAPYQLPEGAPQPFGLKPQTSHEQWLMNSWLAIPDKLALPPFYLNMARDSYDNCLAYLDTCLGELFEELDQRGALTRTWIVITSDHGEGLGEHDLFEHGESLYATEIKVPLLIVPPSGIDHAAVVSETVSLRQLPATMLDLLGLQRDTPFPGRSMATLWRNPSSAAGQENAEPAFSELSGPNPTDPSNGRSPAHRGPLVALAENGVVYIRNDGDRGEELFDEHNDPRELINLIHTPAMAPILQRLRDRLDQLR